MHGTKGEDRCTVHLYCFLFLAVYQIAHLNHAVAAANRAGSFTASQTIRAHHEDTANHFLPAAITGGARSAASAAVAKRAFPCIIFGHNSIATASFTGIFPRTATGHTGFSIGRPRTTAVQASVGVAQPLASRASVIRLIVFQDLHQPLGRIVQRTTIIKPLFDFKAEVTGKANQKFKAFLLGSAVAESQNFIFVLGGRACLPAHIGKSGVQGVADGHTVHTFALKGPDVVVHRPLIIRSGQRNGR